MQHILIIVSLGFDEGVCYEVVEVLPERHQVEHLHGEGLLHHIRDVYEVVQTLATTAQPSGEAAGVTDQEVGDDSGREIVPDGVYPTGESMDSPGSGFRVRVTIFSDIVSHDPTVQQLMSFVFQVLRGLNCT